MANSYQLIIVESPAKARTISKFLDKGYKVEASQGHVRDLPKSQLGIDIDNDFAMKYITIHGRGDILAKLRKEAKGAKHIYLATDPDREGEAIAWHLAQALKIDPLTPCRIEFHEITKKAVKQAIKEAHPIDIPRVDAQQARRALDRIVGYKLSPLLWAKVRKGLSAGRVQSVAVRMLADRENEIDTFIPEEYWDIFAQINISGNKSPIKVKLSLVDNQKPVLTNANDAEAVRARLEAASLTLASVKKGERKKSPTAPFTTSTLQQEASRKLNFTAARTMQVVQGLYEGIDLEKEGLQGLVTYIRTDSIRVNPEAIQMVREKISATYGPEYLPPEANEFKNRSNIQDAHEAIRPTSIDRTPESIQKDLSPEQFKLYRLIYNRFLSSQMKEALYQTLSAEFQGDGLSLRFSGEHKVFAGFTAVYEESSDDSAESLETKLPHLQEGEKAKVLSAIKEQHFTQPPTRFTEASLVKTLEELGIGRPSTYAPTLATIISRGYVSREKKRLYATDLGKTITDIMLGFFNPIVDPAFTADMENKLDDISLGKEKWQKVLADFYPEFNAMIEVAEQTIEKLPVKLEVSDIPCEECGAMMVYKDGRYGRFLACPNFPNCRNTKPVLQYIDAPCPKCGARLLKKVSRKNRTFYGCEHYPECDFVSWDLPTKESCPKCGHYMVLKWRKNDAIRLCASPDCRYHETIETSPENDD